MRTARAYFLTPLVAVLILVGCSGGRETEHTFITETIDGVVTVTNTGAPKYQEYLFRLGTMVTLRPDPDHPASYLRSPAGLTTDGRGLFFVIDGLGCTVAVYDSTGMFLRTIGSPGAGPGEFDYLMLSGISDDVLSLWDFALRRLSRFRTDGTLIDVSPVPLQERRILKCGITPDGDWVITNFTNTDEGQTQLTSADFLTVDSGGETIGSAMSDPVPTAYRTTIVLGEREVPFWENIPFASLPQAEYRPGSDIVISTGQEPTLRCYRLDGILSRIIHLDIEPVPVTAADREEYRAGLTEQLEAAGEGTNRVRFLSMLDHVIFPEYRAYWGVRIDDAGYLWLPSPESVADQEAAGGMLLYRLLSPEGEYLGDMRFPPASLRIEHGFAMGIITSEETGEAIPTIWRLVPSAENFLYP